MFRFKVGRVNNKGQRFSIFYIGGIFVRDIPPTKSWKTLDGLTTLEEVISKTSGWLLWTKGGSVLCCLWDSGVCVSRELDSRVFKAEEIEDQWVLRESEKLFWKESEWEWSWFWEKFRDEDRGVSRTVSVWESKFSEAKWTICEELLIGFVLETLWEILYGKTVSKKHIISWYIQTQYVYQDHTV